MQCGLWMHLSNVHTENLTSTIGMYAEVMEKMMMITGDNDDDDNDDND